MKATVKVAGIVVILAAVFMISPNKGNVSSYSSLLYFPQVDNSSVLSLFVFFTFILVPFTIAKDVQLAEIFGSSRERAV